MATETGYREPTNLCIVLAQGLQADERCVFRKGFDSLGAAAGPVNKMPLFLVRLKLEPKSGFVRNPPAPNSGPIRGHTNSGDKAPVLRGGPLSKAECFTDLNWISSFRSLRAVPANCLLLACRVVAGAGGLHDLRRKAPPQPPMHCMLS